MRRRKIGGRMSTEKKNLRTGKRRGNNGDDIKH